MSNYAVECHRNVEKFLKRHAELAAAWSPIEVELSDNPYPRRGSDVIAHLKGQWLCNHRWKEGGYRFLYEVNEGERIVMVYDAAPRGQVYRAR